MQIKNIFKKIITQINSRKILTNFSAPKLLLGTILAFAFFIIAPHAFADTNIASTTCSGGTLNLPTAHTYILIEDITCNITVSADDVIIDGQGLYTITGNVNGNGGSGAPGYNFTLQNINVTGTVTSNGGGSSSVGGNGGEVTIASSTVTGAVSTDGGDSANGNGGNGGSVTITNSTANNIASGAGGDGYNTPGNGGSVTIATSTVGSVTSGAGGVSSNGNGGDGGSITITNSNVSSVVSGSGGRTNTYGDYNAHGGDGGSITITNSTTTTITSGDGGYGADFSYGGNGGSITITNSTTTTITSGVGGRGGGGNGGFGGSVTITNSTTGNIITSNGGESSRGNGGNGGSVTIATSTVGSVTTGAGAVSIHDNGGDGGSITITSSNVNSVTSGVGGVGLMIGNSGSITITSSQTGAVTSNGFNTGDSGGNAGSITIISSQTGAVTSNGGNEGSGYGNGGYGGAITITASSTVTGAVTANGGKSGSSYFGGGNPGHAGSITITSSQTGAVTSNGGGGRNGGDGGSITITASSTVSGAVSSTGGSGSGTGSGTGGSGDGGSITITASSTVTGTITSNGGNGRYGGNGGDIEITTSSIINGGVTSTGGQGSAYNGGSGGSITISSSQTDAVTSNGGLGSIISGSGGGITITSSQAGAVTSNGAGNGSGGSILINESSTITGAIVSDGGSGGSGGTISIIESSILASTVTANGNGSMVGGSGGSITITSIGLDLSNKTISVAGRSGIMQTGTNGSLTLTYQSLTTNSSTTLQNIGTLTINGTSYIDSNPANSPTCSNGVARGVGCAWNGVFNPLIYYFNNAVDTNWNTLGNWWNDANFTVQASSTPFGYSQVFINGIVATGTGAVADTITFNGTSSNAILVDVTNGANFYDSSSNTGTIISDLVTFYGDLTSTIGGIISTSTIDGIIQRIFNTSATTTRDFTSEGNRSDWIIKAIGNVIVDVSGAIYDLASNAFRALSGALFTWGNNPAGQPTPVITVDLGLEGTGNQIIKWDPEIDWDTATTCIYSYNSDYSSPTTVTCSNNGSDIPRPSTGSDTLYLRGTDANGNYSEKSVDYDYVNDVAIPTYCGTDLLDEATRPYYYLSQNTTADCTATVDTELRGTTTSSTIGYTLTGNVIARGKDISLKLITITGSIDTSGDSNGEDGGSITIATSTTGALVASGANGTGDGGNGGNITVTNSIGINASSTPITTNGGSSTSCGDGGDAGEVTLTNSTYGTITTTGGNAETDGCPSESKSSGQSRTVGSGINISGSYTPPSSGNNTGGDTGANNGGGNNNSSSGLINNIANPDINPIEFAPIQQFTPFSPDFNPINLGATIVPDPFRGFNPPGQISFVELPTNFVPNISAFLFAPIPSTITDALANSPRLQSYMGSVGLATEQDLASLTANPEQLETPDEENLPPGLFVIKSGDTILTSYATYDQASGGLAQLVKVSPNQSLSISLVPLSEGEVTAQYLGQTITFQSSDNLSIAYITSSNNAGRYVLKTSSSPIPLLIEVEAPQTNEPTKKPWGIFYFLWKLLFE